jgi:hypothetical protein
VIIAATRSCFATLQAFNLLAYSLFPICGRNCMRFSTRSSTASPSARPWRCLKLKPLLFSWARFRKSILTRCLTFKSRYCNKTSHPSLPFASSRITPLSQSEAWSPVPFKPRSSCSSQSAPSSKAPPRSLGQETFFCRTGSSAWAAESLPL